MGLKVCAEHEILGLKTCAEEDNGIKGMHKVD